VVAQYTNRDGVALSVLQMDPILPVEYRTFLFVRKHLSRVKTADHTGLVKAHSTYTKILQLMPRMDLLNLSNLSLLRRAKPVLEIPEAQF
jgi:hypothetical protein